MDFFLDYLNSQSQLIEQHLKHLLPLADKPGTSLFEAARYAILGGGKRLRPILTLMTTHLLGGNCNLALTPACTLEMIHSYSLIHDDLPCMDDDDYRRGKPTLHKKYSEGHAVLTGDFLLTYAFEILATDSQLDSNQKAKLIAKLAYHSGSEGMIGGQVMDISYEGKEVSLDVLKEIHRNKTSALMVAALEFGAIISHTCEDHLKHLKDFGNYLGLAFQVTDDVLDVTASHAKHGRSIASDVLNKKPTYVSLLGIEQAKAYALTYYQQALLALEFLPYDTTLLAQLADHVINRKS